ncbi:MAG TPA: TonB-dependent receptor [Bacteroidales bacterium]|nr:TonB-dependent receptor [Bacteroidales bacterium]
MAILLLFQEKDVYKLFCYLHMQRIKTFILTVLLILGGLMSVAQDFDRKISIKVKNKPLGEVISLIGHLSDINFSYSSQQIPVDKNISLKARNASVRSILDELLGKNNIEYTVVENQVILKLSRPEKEQVVPATGDRNSKFTISGYVRDVSTGEALIGAYVYVLGTSIGTTTNGYGFYSLTLPEGKYNLMFSFLGYKYLEEPLDLKANITISRELEFTKSEIKSVEIKSSPQNEILIQEKYNILKLSPKEVSHLPTFAGDFDMIKTLQSIPGIKTYGDGSSLFYVRGGNSDQNLILVDEAPIYNPSHLFGFFSALAPESVNDAGIYKGDFPAKFGGRLSSVIDIKIKEGNMKKFGFSGSLGPYTSYFSLEGPIKKEKCSFYISARKSNLKWITYVLKANKNLKMNFFDVNGKINLRLNDKNRFFLSFYGGQDDYSRINQSVLNTFGITWNNVLGTFRWNHIFSNRLFSNSTIYYSRYNYFLYLSREEKNYWKSAISDITFKTDVAFFLNHENTIRSGISLSYKTFNPGNVSFANTAMQEKAPVIPYYTSLEYALYLSNEQQIGEKLELNYGVRLPVWQNIGPFTLYSYSSRFEVFDTTMIGKSKVFCTYASPEPRFSIKYRFSKKSAVKLSYSRTSQFIQVLTNFTGPFTSLEVWVPCGPNIKPQKTDQLGLSFMQSLFGSGIFLSVDGFYKWFQNTIDYKDHANLLFNPLIEGELRFGNSRAYGAEIVLRKPDGKFTGWIGYTYSRALKKIQGINNDAEFPASYDSPHNIYINLSYDTEKRWFFTAGWMFLTGNPVTTPVSFYYYGGYSVPVYASKNNDRLPDYHRLDVSVGFRLNKSFRKYKHSLVLSLYNVYGRKNPFSVNFNKIETDGDFVIPANNNAGYELVQTTISVAGVIPSLNYKFSF